MPIVKVPTYPLTISATEYPLGFEARGSIEKVRTYQITTVTIDGNMANRRRVQQQKAYHAPVQPDSEAQLAQRQKLTDASTAWAALTPEEKEVWNQLALNEYRQKSGYPGSYKAHNGRHLFMSDHMLTN